MTNPSLLLYCLDEKTGFSFMVLLRISMPHVERIEFART
jgi:hypothetical protein